jgi:hypothetical protein
VKKLSPMSGSPPTGVAATLSNITVTGGRALKVGVGWRLPDAVVERAGHVKRTGPSGVSRCSQGPNHHTHDLCLAENSKPMRSGGNHDVT